MVDNADQLYLKRFDNQSMKFFTNDRKSSIRSATRSHRYFLESSIRCLTLKNDKIASSAYLHSKSSLATGSRIISSSFCQDKADFAIFSSDICISATDQSGHCLGGNLRLQGSLLL